MDANHKPVHEAADYFEPLFRARLVKAMKALRKSISVRDIAMAIAHKNPHLLTTVQVKKELDPAVKVVRNAFRQGGKIGAEKVHKL